MQFVETGRATLPATSRWQTGRTLPRRGVWSDETTVWVSERSGTLTWEQAVRVCGCRTGSRDADRDIDTPGAYKPRAAGRRGGRTGTTIWVAGVFRLPDHTVEPGKVFAYRLSDGARDAARDIDTLAASGSERIQGIWSDGTTMWVPDVTVD